MATLFWPQLKPSQSYSYLKNPSNTATLLIRLDFCGPLVTGLTGFHCIYLSVLRTWVVIIVISECVQNSTDCVKHKHTPPCWKSCIVHAHVVELLVNCLVLTLTPGSPWSPWSPRCPWAPCCMNNTICLIINIWYPGRRTQHQKWVDYVFGSHPCSRGFSPALPTPKTKLFGFQWLWSRMTSNLDMLWMCHS